MSRRVERILLLPRYTTLASGEFLTAPIWVRPFGSMNASVWRGRGLGTTGNEPVAVFTIEQSQDLYIWTELATVTPDADPDKESGLTGDFTMDWIRVKVEVSGTDPVVPCWMVADVAPRET